MKKLHIGQDLLIAGLAVVTLFFALLSALALFPSETDVEISETITMSVSRLNGVDEVPAQYLAEATGVLRNTTSHEIVVDQLTVKAGNSEFRTSQVELTSGQIVIPAWAEIPVSLSVQSSVYCEYVGEITAQTDGKEVYLRNPADTDLSAALVPVIVTVILAFFLVRACKIRYYMAQEDRMDREVNG